MISVRKLSASVRDGEPILSQVSFELKESSILGVYGPNGSGKSTLLRAIAGLPQDKNFEGEIWIREKPLASYRTAQERVREVLYLGSDFHAPFDLSVRELFEMGAEVSTHDRGRTAEMTERFSVQPYLSRVFRSLSDGEKQLMMFIRGLIQNPKALILDETFSKLDLDKLILVSKAIREQAREGMTFLVASHELNFLSEVAGELLFLKKGEAMGFGPLEQLFTHARLNDLYPDLSLQVVRNPETGKLKVIY